MWDRLKRGDKPILLYGMGNGADKILDIMESKGIRADGVFASDEFVRGQIFRGFKVMTYSAARERFGDFIALVSFGTQRADVLDRIKRIAQEVELYAPDVPVYGGGLFDKEYARQNADKLRQVYDRLADGQSRRVFENVVRYRISGDVDCLFNCETDEDELFGNVLRLTNDEVYMDLGAYKGDTVEQFLRHTDGYRRIYAVEPDAKNFKKLAQNTAELDNINLLNVGIYSEYGEMPFDMNSGRNSVLSKNGKNITVDSVDNILLSAPATYIKADVEGQEHNFILGAKNTIKNYRPKMLIACYHRTEDIFALPLDVLDINPDYRLFMRHHPYVPAWDTNYIFV